MIYLNIELMLLQNSFASLPMRAPLCWVLPACSYRYHDLSAARIRFQPEGRTSSLLRLFHSALGIKHRQSMLRKHIRYLLKCLPV
jgi:hypothetical protein